MSTPKQTCYVIMPFSKTSDVHTEEYWTAHYEKFLAPLIARIPELQPQRSAALRGNIPNEIIKEMITAAIVIANLTDLNPNVLWELGIRQSFRHGTITIMEGDVKLPFDILQKGTLSYYPDNYIKNAGFETSLQAALQDCLKNPGRADSPVLELYGRGTLFEIFQLDQAIRRLEALKTETSRNKQNLLRIEKTMKSNAGKAVGQKTYEVVRLHDSSIDLLVTTRYIESPPDFYGLAEEYHDNVIVMNDQLNIWESQTVSTEAWFLRMVDQHKEQLDNFNNALESEYKRLKSLV